MGVTDGSWYRFLAARPELNEVNFWRRSSKHAFRSLGSGEPFFFKTKAPQNQIVGGGFFSDFARLPLSEAWDLFGEANGAASLSELRRRINTNRTEPIVAGDDPVIGCILVRDVRFFALGEEAGPPEDFASNLVQGKRYDLATHPGAGYLNQLVVRLLGRDVEVDDSQQWRQPGETRACRLIDSDRARSRRLCWKRTASVARSPAAGSARPSRPHTSVPSVNMASIVWTTACCSVRIYTPCSTRATSAWTSTTGSRSVHVCERTSKTARSSTRGLASRSFFLGAPPTGPTESFLSGMG